MYRGSVHNSFARRLTKPMVEEFLRMNLRLPVQSEMIKLPEEPAEWKHACISSGVVRLLPKEVACYGQRLVFSLCTVCGKVHYYFDGN